MSSIIPALSTAVAGAGNQQAQAANRESANASSPSLQSPQISRAASERATTSLNTDSKRINSTPKRVDGSFNSNESRKKPEESAPEEVKPKTSKRGDGKIDVVA